jgi:NAD(P)-dependent dehydrogenase (short-subunit alcohol dehydrogenase family)
MTTRFAGKSVLVTGAAGGIGAAAARAFAQEGARVVVSDRLRPSAEMGLSGLKFVEADVTQRSQVDSLILQASSSHSIDILVHAAAILGGSGPFDKVSQDTFKHYLDVNVVGSFNVCQATASSMIETGTKGSIIVFGSVNSLAAEKHAAPYVASKGASRLLVKSMAVDLAEHGIRVNSILPGPIAVPRNKEWFDRPDVRDAFSRSIPLGGPANPEVLIAALFYLADESSAFTTGTDVVIDGGLGSYVPLV